MASLTLRSVKGAPLTNTEVDDNFSNLNTYKVEKTSDTGSAQLPVGTDAQRDGSASAGHIRFNTDQTSFEGFDGTQWGAIGGGFDIIAVSGQSDVVADQDGSTLTVVAGTNISIVTNAATDTITINSTYSYTHPSDGVDLGNALTGANVISDVNVNTAGHVTGFSTRALTPADIGAQASGSYLTTSSSFGGDVSGTYNDIVVTNDSHTHGAANLTGTTLASNVVNSSLTSVGTLTSLNVGSITSTGNVQIDGNLTVSGTTTTIDAANLSVTDNMIYLNGDIIIDVDSITGDGTSITINLVSSHNLIVGDSFELYSFNPTSYNGEYTVATVVDGNTITALSTNTDAITNYGKIEYHTHANPDLGFVGAYDDGTYAHSGLFRDTTDSRWKFFDGYVPEPDADIYIDTSHGTFALADVQANSFIGSLTGNADTATTASGVTANSVALGTDTTGNYVQQGSTSGLGISGSVNSEGGTFTVSSNATTAATASTLAYRDGSGSIAAYSILLSNIEKNNITADGELGFDSSQGLILYRTQQGTNGATTVLDGANVAAGTGITISNLGTGGTATEEFTFALDFSELTDMTADISGTTEFILQNGTTESRKAASEIKLSNFTNDTGWTTNTGTVTSITVGAGNGLTGGGTVTTSGTVTLNAASHSGSAGSIGTLNIAADTIGVNLGTTSTTAAAGNHTHQTITWGTGLSGTNYNGSTATTVNFDFSELTDMTADISGTTEFILQNGTTESRKAASEIKLSAFNNDSGFLTAESDTLATVTARGSSTGTSCTFQNNVTVNGTLLTENIRPDGAGIHLVIEAGESNTYSTGQTGEIVYLNAEDGIQINSSPDNWVSGWAARNTATICASDGTSSFPNDVSVTGLLTATQKSFTIDHPTQEGKKLRYGSLEGPENGVYIRGRLAGSNVIELPEYWTKLVHEDSITVQLTPVGRPYKLYVKEIKDNKVIIKNGSWFCNKIDCFYGVYGERADVDKLTTEF